MVMALSRGKMNSILNSMGMEMESDLPDFRSLPSRASVKRLLSNLSGKPGADR